jgi:hypothetical protein
VFLTTYVDHHPGSAQYNWFIADMTTNLNRALTPWVVVVSIARSISVTSVVHRDLCRSLTDTDECAAHS